MAAMKSNAIFMGTQHEQSPSDAGAKEKFPNQPYLQCLEDLQYAFPPLQSFLRKISNFDRGRELVEEYYRAQNPSRVPGRCYCLQFGTDRVSLLEGCPDGFAGPDDLADYLTKHPATTSRRQNQRRLFILEDLDPNYIDVLGHHLGVDPLVFSEQMNTWNFADSDSIPYRGLPSITSPQKSFTMRYYEIRTLEDPKSVDTLSFQMTFAANRRRYERWRDIDLPLSGFKDRRNAFVRRSASFWTSQDPDIEDFGWDALLLVDPGMGSINAGSDTTYILKDPGIYADRQGIWNAHDWKYQESVEMKTHKSIPYHAGCPTLASLLFPVISDEAQTQVAHFQDRRDLTSPLDEQVFYWTKVASKELIRETYKESSNTAYYLLKYIAQNWVSQLELINCTVAKGEYLSDDFQATIDDNLSQRQWKTDLLTISKITKDINYMRRQMNHFWRAIVLNLERLGIQLSDEQIDTSRPLAIRGAQKDLLNIHTRTELLRERVEGLGAIANDLANLRAAFRGVQDGEFGQRLSLFASVVFPLTLVAGIFSMNDKFLPGAAGFWKFWAVSIPFVIAFAIGLTYGWRLYQIPRDTLDIFTLRTIRESKMHWKGKGQKSSAPRKDAQKGGPKRLWV